MGGYKDHRNALKRQNISADERKMMVDSAGKNKKLEGSKLFPEGDTTLSDTFEAFLHGTQSKSGVPYAYESPESLQQEVVNFFKYCDEKKLMPTIPLLSSWLGVDSYTLTRWSKDSASPFYGVMRKVTELLHSVTLQKALDGSINTILYFFLSKNWYGMQDKTEIVHKTTEQNVIDLDEQKRILSATPGVVIDAEYHEFKDSSESKELSTDLGTNTRDLEKVSQNQNLSDLETTEDLDKILVGDLET